MTAQQLRNSILQEAIEGRLVPQDPNDEPASILLERIREEKKRLVKEGKLKKKDLEEKPISEDEIPFEIPESWEWCRIKTIFSMQAGKNVTSANINSEKNDTFKYPCFGGNGLRGYVKQYNTEGTFPLVGRQGALCGNVNIATGQFWATEHAVVTDGFGLTDVKWAYYFLMALNLNQYATATAQPGLAVSNIIEICIPLPPLAEQHRIVERIELLFPKVEEFANAQEKLNKLNEELPEKLKKSILQEAIEGRLVPQDPNDEPASALLAKIREEKKQLVKEGKLKKKDLEEKPISEDEIPFSIPDSWEWVRLGDMVSNQTGLSYNKGDLEKKVDNPIRVLRGGNIQNGSWSIKVDDVMIAPEFVKKQNLTLKKNTFITPAVTSLEHLGKTALIEENHEDIVAGGFVLYLLPFYREDTFMKYLAFYFQSAFYNEYCKSIANKSGQAFWNLSRQKLMSLTIPIPPLAEQYRIIEKLKQLLGGINKIKK